MAASEDVLRAVYETFCGYLAIGNTAVAESNARFVHNAEAPNVYDANFVYAVRAEAADDLRAVMDRADELFAGSRHRQLLVDPWTPPSVEAALTVRGFAHHAEVELLLEGPLEGAKTSPNATIRLVESEADWIAVERLMHLDRQEQAERVHTAYDDDVTRQLVATRRTKVPDVSFWVARSDGTDCGYFSSWPGVNGVGEVEYLFVHPDFRHRGVATALIARSVDDARDRGANAVLIGARVDDTPMQMYEAMGFRPVCMNRAYLKTGG